MAWPCILRGSHVLCSPLPLLLHLAVAMALRSLHPPLSSSHCRLCTASLNEPSHGCPRLPPQPLLAPSHPIPRSKSFPGSQGRSVLGPEPDYISVQVRGLLWVFPGLNFPMSHQVREYDQISPRFLPAAYYRSREPRRPPSITEDIWVCNVDSPQKKHE